MIGAPSLMSVPQGHAAATGTPQIKLGHYQTGYGRTVVRCYAGGEDRRTHRLGRLGVSHRLRADTVLGCII